jgi:hypothetical protein
MPFLSRSLVSAASVVLALLLVVAVLADTFAVVVAVSLAVVLALGQAVALVDLASAHPVTPSLLRS